MADLDPVGAEPTVDTGVTGGAAPAVPAASRSHQRAPLSAQVAAVPQAVAAQSARALARDILAERTAAIENAAADAARATLVAVHKACAYAPAVQRHPD